MSRDNENGGGVANGESDVVQFPAPGRPAKPGAAPLQVWRWRAKEWMGRLLGRIGVPGAVRDTVLKDGVTGQHIEVRVGPLFTRVTVNGRDYYFDRWSGRYDGTGFGCG